MFDLHMEMARAVRARRRRRRTLALPTSSPRTSTLVRPYPYGALLLLLLCCFLILTLYVSLSIPICPRSKRNWAKSSRKGAAKGFHRPRPLFAGCERYPMAPPPSCDRRPHSHVRTVQRELSGQWDAAHCAAVHGRLVEDGAYENRPKPRTVARLENQLFCGRFSADGEVFVSACQDRHIRLYDASNVSFRLIRDVTARDVGWSILDTDISPDRSHLLYSSWSDYSTPTCTCIKS